ncbi:hypothetical protein BC936DRAFT_137542 [Jimgerdemannia flammicorona]|uniref:Uncharacterized protein n=1 Tax=Jimgerdemannia flammicorona TaxID=994334 RepID=A0A433CX49_9FUNG|nr:hypothetical protein BC936DRAFT_137542 [Jimgerdemannia flammicorona]
MGLPAVETGRKHVKGARAILYVTTRALIGHMQRKKKEPIVRHSGGKILTLKQPCISTTWWGKQTPIGARLTLPYSQLVFFFLKKKFG